MRVDVEGKLWMVRNPGGTIDKINVSDGSIIRSVNTLGSNPSNVCFGGADGRTVYVTEVAQKRLIQFRVDVPGLEWTRLHLNK